MHGVRTPDRLGPSLGKADVRDLACLDQLAEGADRLLDRCRRVDAVLVVDVDVVGPEADQRSLEGGTDVLRAVVLGCVPVAVGDHPELCRQDHFGSAPRDRASDELLVRVGAVDLGRVDQGDPEVEGAVDRADRLSVVDARSRVVGRHAHAAEAEPRDLQAVK